MKPEIELNLNALEDMTGNGFEVKLKLNELEGGSASAWLYKKDGDSFVPVESSRRKYPLEASDEVSEVSEGIWTTILLDNDLQSLGNDDPGQRYTAKVVVEYTYPDSTGETLESNTFEQYGGSFARFTNNPEYAIDPATNTLSFEVAIDLSLVEIENLEDQFSYLFQNLSELTPPTLSSSYDAGDGTYRMVYSIPLDTLSAGKYDAGVGFMYCNNDAGPHWECEKTFSFTLS